MGLTEDERLARATLARIAEPGDEALGRLVSALGARGAVEVVRSGELPPKVPCDEKERAGFGTCIHRCRIRLCDLRPDQDPIGRERTDERFVCPGDPEWPTQLDDLDEKRPYGLWLRGVENLRFGCLKSVAVVGSRAATPYGVHVASEMGAELAERGWTVVSGGAFGIDGAAHRGALAADGLTAAVLACGVDVAYPRAHTNLFEEMARNGLLVSEVPPGVTPTRLRFLVRNRVIAALTRGTVVVEAAARSGAVSTAGHARDLGRTLMTVPGPVTSRMSVGCHRLLREWEAKCVTDAADVLDLVGRIGDDMAPERRGPVRARDALDPTTRDVLEAVPARDATSPAKIAVTARVDIDTALGRLGMLAAGGFIERCGHGWRIRRQKKGEG